MTCAQCKAARRKAIQDPRYGKHRRRPLGVKEKRRARQAIKAAKEGRSFGYIKKR